jgi:hypothetical protein
MLNRRMVAPHCITCEELMVWKNEQIVNGKHMQIFQCGICEKMKAVLLPSEAFSNELAAQKAYGLDERY